jgi:hypothetical protein
MVYYSTFYLLYNSKKAPLTVVQTSFKYYFFYDDEWFVFKQTYLWRYSTLWGKD